MPKNSTLDTLAALKEQWDQETESLIDLLLTGLLGKMEHTTVVEVSKDELVSLTEKWKMERRFVVHPRGTVYRMQLVPRVPVNQDSLDL